MTKMPSFEPWGARLLSTAEVGNQLAQLIAMHEQFERMTFKGDPDLALRHEMEAEHWREFRWLLEATDKVWLLTEPPHHPDFIQGSVYLVVIRHGELLIKQRLVAA